MTETDEPAPPKVLTIAEAIETHIRQVLPLFRWNLSQAARALDIDRRTLYRCAKRYKIERPAAEASPGSPAPEAPARPSAITSRKVAPVARVT